MLCRRGRGAAWTSPRSVPCALARPAALRRHSRRARVACRAHVADRVVALGLVALLARPRWALLRPVPERARERRPPGLAAGPVVVPCSGALDASGGRSVWNGGRWLLRLFLAFSRRGGFRLAPPLYLPTLSKDLMSTQSIPSLLYGHGLELCIRSVLSSALRSLHVLLNLLSLPLFLLNENTRFFRTERVRGSSWRPFSHRRLSGPRSRPRIVGGEVCALMCLGNFG